MTQPTQRETRHSAPADMRMGIVSLTVAELDRSLRFYEDVLGAIVLARRGNSVALGGEHPLLVLTERRHAVAAPEPATGLYHYALLLPGRVDLARMLRQLLESGYPVREMSDHGISEAIYLADPEGNGIELCRDRPRSAWPWTNGRLEASEPSVPLSSENLLAELEGTDSSWRGLSALTSIGHVHLRVSDLAQTTEFYQGLLGLEESITGIKGACFFAAGGYHHHIGCNAWSSLAAPAPPPTAMGLRFFTLVFPEESHVRQLVSQLREAGRTVTPCGQAYLLRDACQTGVMLTTQSCRHAEEALALDASFEEMSRDV